MAACPSDAYWLAWSGVSGLAILMTSAPLLVFDLDGTLVDTAPDLVAALNVTLAKERVPEMPLESARNMIGGGARKMLERALEAEGRDCGTAEVTRMTNDFIAYYAANIAVLSRPFEGLEETLDQLAGDGFAFAVCTNKLELLSKRLLDALGLSGRFAAICGAETDVVDDHDRRRRPRRRRGPPRRRAGDRRDVRLHRSSDRSARTRSGDLADATIAGGGRQSMDPVAHRD